MVEHQDKIVIKIFNVDLESNDADIMTKNLGSELHIKHTARLLGK